MVVSPADALAAEILAVRRAVQQMEPLSRTRPHVFGETKIEIEKQLDALATRVRCAFGGTPVRLATGAIRGPTGLRVQVEHRKARRA